MSDHAGERRQDESSGRKQFDELLDSYVERVRRGEKPSLSEYEREFPWLADKIREIFPVVAVLAEAPADADGTTEFPGDLERLED